MLLVWRTIVALCLAGLIGPVLLDASVIPGSTLAGKSGCVALEPACSNVIVYHHLYHHRGSSLHLYLLLLAARCEVPLQRCTAQYLSKSLFARSTLRASRRTPPPGDPRPLVPCVALFLKHDAQLLNLDRRAVPNRNQHAPQCFCFCFCFVRSLLTPHAAHHSPPQPTASSSAVVA